MPNYCWNTIRVNGPVEQRDLLNELFERHTRTHDEDVIIDFSAIAGGDLEVGSGWWYGSVDEDGETTTVEIQTAWGPPGEFVRRVSERFQDLVIKMTFSIEDQHGSQEYEFFRGNYRLISDYSGSFVFRVHDTSPTHHWRHGLGFATAADRERVMSALRAARIVAYDYDAVVFDEELMFRLDASELSAWIRQHFPDVEFHIHWSRRYTLDEDAFLGDIENQILADNDPRQPLDLYDVSEERRQALRLLERRVELFGEEIAWVIEGLIRQMRNGRVDIITFFRLETVRNDIGRQAFDELYRDRLWEALAEAEDDEPGVERIRQHYGFREEVSRARGYGGPYAPLATELRTVLEQYQQVPDFPGKAERIRVIQSAIDSPRWVDEWPAWDEPAPVRGNGDDGDGGEPDDTAITPEDEELLRELENFGDPPPDSPSRVDWRKEGF